MLSLLLAPNRGLLWRWLNRRRNRRRLRTEAVLADLYTLANQHEDSSHAHEAAVIRTMRAGGGGVDHTLRRLQERGLVRKEGESRWALTPEGMREAQRAVAEMEED